MKNLMPILCLLFSLPAFKAPAQIANRPIPKHIPGYEFKQFGTSYQGYYLTAPFKIGAQISATGGKFPKPAMILDADGYLVWYMPVFSPNLLDFKYAPQHNRYSWINYVNPADIRYMLMDENFQLLDSFTTTQGVDPDLHEFQITDDATYLLSGVRDSIMDLSGYVFNGTQGSSQTKVIGFVVQEFDANHQLLFNWNSNDHIHPSLAYAAYGYNASNFDYCHGNAIWEDFDGGLLLSFRNLDAVYKINRQSGQVEWQLGGKSSSFTFVNDAGFSGQHDIRRLPNGNVSVFDNANTAAIPKKSRAVEYQLDMLNWTATKVWEYIYAPPFFSPAMGNHHTSPDRNHLINYGLNFRPQPSFVHTDDSGNKLSELFFTDSFMSYRSYIFDLPIDLNQRPSITCTQEGNHIMLSAPLGFDQYAWSTSDSTSSITVQGSGTFQVWVSHGAGMLGSEPFVISNMDKGCPLVGTNAPKTNSSVPITRYFDLLGRKVDRPVPGQLYLVQFENGSAALHFWVE